ncbi:unnamed protein product [Clonostachys rosea]|uniref:DUF676 domain-containing protein n=1 Tax=Bionectria ochroleuca TaxID=29856 RepID=A0ABY6UG11_BIOOC|nr:unnamed protein product [Clonostachys rosea]
MMDSPGQISALATIAIFTVFIWCWVLGGHARLKIKDAPMNKETPVSKKLPKDCDTFRVVGAPDDWDPKQLGTFLAGRKSSMPIVKSLAREIHNRSQTATVTFQDLLLSPESRQSASILLPKPSDDRLSGNQYLILDKAFLGITTLYTPPTNAHKIDVIALSGLGGHAFESFKERGGDHMWLRDSLPYDITWEETGQPMARVMTYGYESGVVESENIQNIEDLATTFHSSLHALAPIMRPIILIAHSLGGLIVKQALVALSKSNNEDDQNLVRAIYGLVFFGVPHDGMDISSLIPMVGDGPSRFLVESIGHISSQILTIQQREFPTALGDKECSEVFCFYETLKSPTAQKTNDGRWEMNGPPAILVTKSSATHCRPWENGPEHICAIARTHSNMVRFGPQDHEYANVRERLRGLARRALTVRDRIQARIPYNQNPDFVGRSNILYTLKQQLGLGQPRGSVELRTRVALSGLGGVGKTQIALAYIYWLRNQRPDIAIFWVHASNAERFHQAYASIAKECNVPRHDDPKADLLSLVQEWLENKYKNQWLMVIDNADDMDLFFPYPMEAGLLKITTAETRTDYGLGRYIPECKHGSVIITTRDMKTGSRLARGKLPIKVGNMNETEAHSLLYAILEDEISADKAYLLSSRLEHLPLALVQAAAFIQENGITLTEYVQLLDESDSAFVDRLSEPFETVGRDSKTPHAVTATWIISFKKIQQRSPLESDLLCLMSFFHWQAIPKQFIEDYCNRRQLEDTDPIEPGALTKALGTLKAFSFISEDKDRNINMHRLVQLVTRKWLDIDIDIDIERKNFAQLALKMVSDAYPFGQFETRDKCLRLLPHAYAVLRQGAGSKKDERISRALLLHRMGGYFLSQGQWDKAEQHQIEAAKIFREEEGGGHASMINLALVYSNQGRWKEAEKLLMQVMKTFKIKLGEDHPNTLTSMNNLASVLWNQGRWKEAEKLEVQVIETRKMKLGADHPSILVSMNNLASTYRNQGRWEEAEKLLMQVMKAFKIKLGKDHPNTLTSINNLASVLWNQGRWKEAEKLEVQVMETRKMKLGAGHPSTLVSMNNLAYTWKSMGKETEAIDLMQTCIRLSKIQLGADHPDTRSSVLALHRWQN